MATFNWKTATIEEVRARVDEALAKGRCQVILSPKWISEVLTDYQRQIRRCERVSAENTELRTELVRKGLHLDMT